MRGWYKWEWDLPWPPRSAWSVTDTRRCTPVCTGPVPPTSQSHSSARRSHCHPVNNVHVRLHTYVLANIMQGQRNDESQQDTRRVFFYFKVNSHVLTLPSLMATSLLRQNLSNFLQTLSLSCNKAQTIAWLIYKILTIIHKPSELFEIALYR